jgi:4-fold beta-flower domain-containing protein
VTPIFGRGSSHLGWVEEQSGFIFDRYLQPRAFVRGEYVFAFPGKGFVAVKLGGIFYNRSMKAVGFVKGATVGDPAPKPLATPPMPVAPPAPRTPQKPPAPSPASMPTGLRELAPFELLEDGY